MSILNLEPLLRLRLNSTTDDTTVIEGTRTTTVRNARGTVILQKTEAIGFGSADGQTYDLMAVTNIDSLGRPLETAYHPDAASVTGEVAAATNPAWTTSTTYDCCGVASETDRTGVTTLHAYDALRRRIKTHHL